MLTFAISCCFDTRGELQAGPDCFAGGLGMFLIILLCRRQAVFVADLTQKQHPAVVLPKKMVVRAVRLVPLLAGRWACYGCMVQLGSALAQPARAGSPLQEKMLMCADWQAVSGLWWRPSAQFAAAVWLLAGSGVVCGVDQLVGLLHGPPADVCVALWHARRGPSGLSGCAAKLTGPYQAWCEGQTHVCWIGVVAQQLQCGSRLLPTVCVGGLPCWKKRGGRLGRGVCVGVGWQGVRVLGWQG